MILGEIDVFMCFEYTKREAKVIYFLNDYLFFVCRYVKALGKEHRERKWVTCNEILLAFVAYSKPQVVEDQKMTCSQVP